MCQRRKGPRRLGEPDYSLCPREIIQSLGRFLWIALQRRNSSKQKRNAVDPRKVEVKYLDYTSVSGSIGNGATNWSLWYVPRMTRGSEAYSRVGNQIFARRLHLKLQLLRNNAGATVQRMRVLVAKVPEPEGTASSASSVYSNPSAFDPYLTPEYRNFQILWQKSVALEAGKSSSEIDVVIPLNFDIRYIANAGTVADCQRNNVELIIWSDQTTNQPTVNVGSWRLEYTD